ncbi:MAG TPA: hypothetical protein VMV86_00035 [Methanosarcinales archaeon]|nr:hypothetical protein [Methanosarcinales archaeon]
MKNEFYYNYWDRFEVKEMKKEKKCLMNSTTKIPVGNGIITTTSTWGVTATGLVLIAIITTIVWITFLFVFWKGC